jgi:hypothetical protein
MTVPVWSRPQACNGRLRVRISYADLISSKLGSPACTRTSVLNCTLTLEKIGPRPRRYKTVGFLNRAIVIFDSSIYRGRTLLAERMGDVGPSRRVVHFSFNTCILENDKKRCGPDPNEHHWGRLFVMRKPALISRNLQRRRQQSQLSARSIAGIMIMLALIGEGNRASAQNSAPTMEVANTMSVEPNLRYAGGCDHGHGAIA